jgi:hypothetical protein
MCQDTSYESHLLDESVRESDQGDTATAIWVVASDQTRLPSIRSPFEAEVMLLVVAFDDELSLPVRNDSSPLQSIFVMAPRCAWLLHCE